MLSDENSFVTVIWYKNQVNQIWNKWISFLNYNPYTISHDEKALQKKFEVLNFFAMKIDP